MRSGSSRFKRLAALVAIALAIAFALAGCSADSGRDVAATFGDETIYEDEVTSYTADFREQGRYDTDEIWAEYLAEQGLVTKTWRERVIGSMAEDRLVAKKAAELGITPDAERVDAQIEADKESAAAQRPGESADVAWRAYLEDLGETEGEYRASLEQASVEQQLYLSEVSFDVADSADAISEYVDENLADRVTRRYSALCYDSEEAAAQALSELQGLSGDELAARFSQLLGQDDSDATTVENGGDIGWDLLADWGDVREDLNAELPAVGAVSNKVHEIDGKYYVLRVTDRFVFKLGMGYDDMPDDELKDYLETVVTYSQWGDKTAEYVAGLVAAANVQVRPMPDGLPYDVDDLIPQTEAYQARANPSN